MANFIVTGGAGFIGSHTCFSLLQKGHKVIAIDSFFNSSKNNLRNILDILLAAFCCLAFFHGFYMISIRF